MSKFSMDTEGLVNFCNGATVSFCIGVDISPDDLYADKAVMFYLGHPQANVVQWHEEWCKLRAAEGFKLTEEADSPGENTKPDPRMKPLAELDELEQIKYVVFLNMFRTLRQLL